MMCDCIKKVNEKLIEKGSNTAIDVPLRINFQTNELSPPICAIATKKVNNKSKKKAALIIANYCPFCGVKYE
jgi:hypothetical protein